MRVNAKPITSAPKTREVELGGMHRRSVHVPEEICPARAGQKSAEVIVAIMPTERWVERRTEEQRKQLKENLIAEPEMGVGNDGTPQLR